MRPHIYTTRIRVDPKQPKALYKNGVLEVALQKEVEKPKGELIEI